MKTNSVIETTIVADSLILVFANGERLEIGDAQLNTEIRRAAMFHGLKQKLCDAAAMSRNPETGKPATVDEKFAAVKAVYERLLVGQWNAPRGEGGSSGGLLYRALVLMYDGRKSAVEIREWLDNKTDAEKRALRETSKIAAIIESLRPVKSSAVDADALLADLE